MKLAQDTHDVDSKSTQKVYSFNQKKIRKTSLLNVKLKLNARANKMKIELRGYLEQGRLSSYCNWWRESEK